MTPTCTINNGDTDTSNEYERNLATINVSTTTSHGSPMQNAMFVFGITGVLKGLDAAKSVAHLRQILPNYQSSFPINNWHTQVTVCK
jgi:hypothetical protein